MPRNGSGTMSRGNGNFTGATTWADQAASNALISSSQHDTHDQDIADEITNSVAADGQSTMSGNLKMGSNKVTGVGAGTAATDAATIGGAETLTNKTLTTPKIAIIYDTNGDDVLKTAAATSTATAVNEITVTNAVASSAPSLSATGTDTDVDLNLVSKGAGNVQVNGTDVFAGPISGTEQATTSGTTVDFTSIPSWVKRIVVQFVAVQTSGTSRKIIQIGDSGGIETTGYAGAGANIGSGSTAITTAPDGFAIGATSASSHVLHGSITITLEDAANFTWVASGTIGLSESGVIFTTGGSKSLSAALDRIRFTTSNGTDTLTAGAINILYD